MTTVGELFLASMDARLSKIPYMIYWALTNGLIDESDDSIKLQKIQIDWDVVDDLIKQDVLQIHKIQAYAFSYDSTFYHIVFAKNEKDASEFILRTWRNAPNRLYNVTSRMDVEFYSEETESYFTPRELLQSATYFPHHAFSYQQKH